MEVLMALINDFKILQNRCVKYYELLNKVYPLEIQQTTPTSKARFGFYLFMLENICNIKEEVDPNIWTHPQVESFGCRLTG